MNHEFLYDVEEEVPTVEQLLEECMPLQAMKTEATPFKMETHSGEELQARKQETEEPGKAGRKVIKARVSAAKRTTDRHVKVEGRGRSVRLPDSCADELFELTRRLNYQWAGQTICWLLENAEPAIIKAMGGKEKKKN